MKKIWLSVVWFFVLSQAQAQSVFTTKDQTEIVSVLQQLYLQYPSTRLTGDPGRLKTAATHQFNMETGQDLEQIVTGRSSDFLSAREIALKNLADLPPKPPTKVAYVSGLSIGGMIAAAILEKSGYEVHAFEKRMEYTRNIQWAVRESLIA